MVWGVCKVLVVRSWYFHREFHLEESFIFLTMASMMSMFAPLDTDILFVVGSTWWKVTSKRCLGGGWGQSWFWKRFKPAGFWQTSRPSYSFPSTPSALFGCVERFIDKRLHKCEKRVWWQRRYPIQWESKLQTLGNRCVNNLFLQLGCEGGFLLTLKGEKEHGQVLPELLLEWCPVLGLLQRSSKPKLKG